MRTLASITYTLTAGHTLMLDLLRYGRPPLAQVLFNTYQAPVRCVIQGSGEVSSSEGTTQGDPLAMAMYALAVRPLIDRLQSPCPTVKQVWYADDATGAATCSELRTWWDTLLAQGQSFGYHPNASKTHLIVKEQFLDEARRLFEGTNVNITVHGKRHLGAAIGSREYTEQYVGDKVKAWTQELLQLAENATSQPHAAYAAFVHGLSSRWTYLSRTIPEVSDLFQPLEDAIHQVFIPSLTGRPPCSKLIRDLLALPVRLGGLGLTNPTVICDDNFQASVKLTAPLVAVIATQDQTLEIDPNDIFVAKTEIRASNRQHSEDRANVIYSQLTPEMKRCVDLTKERGSSSWLSVLPLSEQGFHLHKGEFRDALCLRYGWSLTRHKEIRDLTASLLTEVCPNVAIEPHLQPLSGESFRLASTNTDDGARLDVRARGFWNMRQDAFFDVRVFHPNAPRWYSTPMHPATVPEAYPPRTRSTRTKRKERMASAYSKSSMASSPHLYSQHQEAWVEKHKPSTNAWLTYFPSNVTCPTAPSWGG